MESFRDVRDLPAWPGGWGWLSPPQPPRGSRSWEQLCPCLADPSSSAAAVEMGDWGQGSWGLPTFYRPLGIGSESPPTGKAWPVHPGSSWKLERGAGGRRTADRCKGSRPSFAGGPSFSLSKIWGGGSPPTDAWRRRGGSCWPPPHWPAIPGFFPLPCWFPRSLLHC